MLRVGRRGTKTRFALIASVVGHGAGEDGAKQFPGIMEGWDVVWIAQDYPNLLRVAWKEEIKPRFGDLPWATLSERDHTCSIRGLGTLHFASAEAIKGIRGMGKRVKGVIIDEAAWLDLEEALLDVILPVLLDNDGWLIVMSTTNAGPDGNVEKRVPAYFNVICEQIRAGDRGPDWAEFYGTAFDNPTISNDAIQALIDEYPPGSPKLKQEVYAELLTAGVGIALPELSKAHHIVARYLVPSHWPQFGAFDWGFNHPWAFGWYAADEDGNVVKIDTLWGREDQIEDIIAKIYAAVPVRKLASVHAGTDIFSHKGAAVGFRGPTMGERMQLAGIPAIPASTARVIGLDNLRMYVHWDERKPPRFTMMETEGNLRCFAQLSAMQIDPKNLEDALKVDADAAGRGGDDGYDETRYGLMSRPLLAHGTAKKTLPEDRSIGYDYGQNKPRERQSAESELDALFQRARGSVTHGRYSVPRR